MKQQAIRDGAELKQFLKAEIKAILDHEEEQDYSNLRILRRRHHDAGVNGTGKTTTTGKLAAYFRRNFAPPRLIAGSLRTLPSGAHQEQARRRSSAVLFDASRRQRRAIYRRNNRRYKASGLPPKKNLMAEWERCAAQHSESFPMRPMRFIWCSTQRQVQTACSRQDNPPKRHRNRAYKVFGWHGEKGVAVAISRGAEAARPLYRCVGEAQTIFCLSIARHLWMRCWAEGKMEYAQSRTPLL